MAESSDFEKDKSSQNSKSVTARSSIADHKKETRPSPAQSISSDSISIDSDPLSPLENALTTNLETPVERLAHVELSYTKTGTSFATFSSRNPSFEVDFADDDPEDPRNWSFWYRATTTGVVSYTTWTVVLYSTSYTSAMPGLMKEFGVTSEPVATLGVTTYLTGLATGSLIVAPLSEIYGRRPIYIGCLLFFCLMILPCALATSLAEILITRFIGYVCPNNVVLN